MKTRQQSLHDEGWQSRAGKEGDAQKLDDVRVAEGAHKPAFTHELRFYYLAPDSADAVRGNACGVHDEEIVVELFRDTDGSRHGHFPYSAEGSAADLDASLSHIGYLYKCFSSGNCSAMIFVGPLGVISWRGQENPRDFCFYKLIA